MVKLRQCEVESVFEMSLPQDISKRRYGVETKGNSMVVRDRMKSNFLWCECLWLEGYKPSTFVEGVRNEKMRSQIHKDSHPDWHVAET